MELHKNICKELSAKITCTCSTKFPDRVVLFCGGSEGEVVQISSSNASVQASVDKSTTLIKGKAVTHIAVNQTEVQDKPPTIWALCAETLYALKYPGLQPLYKLAEGKETVKVGLFCVSRGAKCSCVCVYNKKKLLQVYEYDQTKIEPYRKSDTSSPLPVVPNDPACIEWIHDTLVIGYKKEYLFVSINTCTVSTPLQHVENNPPCLCNATTSDSTATTASNTGDFQLLLKQKNTASFVTLEGQEIGKGNQPDATFSFEPLAVAYSPPYVIGINAKKIEVFSLTENTFTNAMDFNQTSTKGIHVTSVNGNVFIANGKDLFVLAPIIQQGDKGGTDVLLMYEETVAELQEEADITLDLINDLLEEPRTPENKSRMGKLLAALQRTGEQVPQPLWREHLSVQAGVQETIETLKHPTMWPELVLEYSCWVLSRHIDEAVEIFLVGDREAELKAQEVIEILHRYPLNVALLPYLEWLVDDQHNREELVHTQLAQVYIKCAETLLPISPLHRRGFHLPAGCEAGYLGELRLKLMKFLNNEDSVYCTDTVLFHLRDSQLYDELVAVYARCGEFEEAIKTLMFKQQNLKGAEEFCLKQYAAFLKRVKDYREQKKQQQGNTPTSPFGNSNAVSQQQERLLQQRSADLVSEMQALERMASFTTIYSSMDRPQHTTVASTSSSSLSSSLLLSSSADLKGGGLSRLGSSVQQAKGKGSKSHDGCQRKPAKLADLTEVDKERLLSLFIDPEKSADVYPNNPLLLNLLKTCLYPDKGHEQQLEFGLHLLNKHASAMNPLEVLALLPGTKLTVNQIYPYIKKMLQVMTHRKRIDCIISSVYTAHHHKVSVQKKTQEAKRVEISIEGSPCHFCKRAIGEKMFVMFPNGVMVHATNKCMPKGPHICPVTNIDFRVSNLKSTPAVEVLKQSKPD